VNEEMDFDRAWAWCRTHDMRINSWTYPEGHSMAGQKWWEVWGVAFPRDEKKDKVRITYMARSLEEAAKMAKDKYDGVVA
jgi:hypothetical protein